MLYSSNGKMQLGFVICIRHFREVNKEADTLTLLGFRLLLALQFPNSHAKPHQVLPKTVSQVETSFSRLSLDFF